MWYNFVPGRNTMVFGSKGALHMASLRLVRPEDAPPPLVEAVDMTNVDIAELRLLLDDAMIAARYLFEMHPDPAFVEVMFGSLWETLKSISKLVDMLNPPL
jgi:hypothetical protein